MWPTFYRIDIEFVCVALRPSQQMLSNAIPGLKTTITQRIKCAQTQYSDSDGEYRTSKPFDPELHARDPASKQCRAIIDPPAKHHLNGGPMVAHL